MEKKLLPIGSVVRLKEGTKKLMVTGFCMVAKEDSDKMYDYVGCLYPVGVVSSDKNLVFNHDQIEEIFFLGYTNIEEQDFKEKLYGELEKGQAVGEQKEIVKDDNSGEEVSEKPIKESKEVEQPVPVEEETSLGEEPVGNLENLDVPSMEDILGAPTVESNNDSNNIEMF